MTESSNEYCLLHYVPNVLSDKRVSIAAIIFFDSSDPVNGVCVMICAADWQTKVRTVDSDADLDMLEAQLTEIGDRLLSPNHRFDRIRQLEDSFSNVVQVSPRRRYPLARNPEAAGAFARRLLEKASKISPGSSGARTSTFE